MDTPWQIELLGRLRAVQPDRTVARFRTQKTGALLAYLAYRRERPHPREELIELLWPETDPAAGRASLSTALASLRRQLEPPGVPQGAVLQANRASVQLRPTATATDVDRYESALQAAAGMREEREQEWWLAQAVQCYQGELLPGYFEDWILPERQRLAEMHQQALARLIALREKTGDLRGALNYARGAVGADPLREEAQHTLIRLLQQAGQREAALRQYRELERRLAEQLGVSPAPETAALALTLEQPESASPFPFSEATQRCRGGVTQDRAGAAAEVGPSSSPPAAPAPGQYRAASPPWTAAAPAPPLPLQFTRFFGREAEIERLQAVLLAPETRLVTLTGPGGSGKTRLAIEVAGRLAASFGGGAPPRSGGLWFVPLLDLADPALIAETVRDRLHLPRTYQIAPLEQIITFLFDRRALLLLDNFEHLVEGGTETIRALLERVPALTVLITSRRCLGLEGERDIPVGPLPTPAGNESPERILACESVQLFADRAQAVRPDFQVTPGNAAAVAQLCAGLEGLPLALELAAARSGVLTCQQMLAHLRRRFELLTSRQRAADARHRSLRATLDWSYQILPAALQRFFARLSVFRGGWTLEAAAAVCGEGVGCWALSVGSELASPTHDAQRLSPALEYLERLRECSLVLAEGDREEMRFRMLETIREFACEQLTREGSITLPERHLQYYLALAEEAWSGFYSAEQGPWLDRLEADHGNLRAALAWSAESEEGWQIALRLAAALQGFWVVRGHWSEGRRWLEAALSRAQGTGRTAARAEALCGVGWLAEVQCEYETARPLLQESIAIYRELGERRGLALSLRWLGFVLLHLGDAVAAEALQRESVALCRKIGDRWLLVGALNSLAAAIDFEGDEGQALLEESLAIARELGSSWGIAANLDVLGCKAWERGDSETARLLLEACLAQRRQIGHQEGIARELLQLGAIALAQADWAAARSCLEQSLLIHRDLGLKVKIAMGLEGIGRLARACGQPERAARLMGATDALCEVLGCQPDWTFFDRASRERHVAAVRACLGEKAFAAAWAAGKAMSLEQAICAALEETVISTFGPNGS